MLESIRSLFAVVTTGAVLGRQNTSLNNLRPDMAASDFLP